MLDIITPLMMAAASGEDVTAKLDELFPYAIKKTYEPFLSPSMATELGLSFLNYSKANTDEGRIRHLTNSYKLIDVIETFCDHPLKLDIFFSKTIISCSTSENNSELKNRKLKVNNLPFDCIYNFLLFNT